jgi:polysaccharide export outer membrane protein
MSRSSKRPHALRAFAGWSGRPVAGPDRDGRGGRRFGPEAAVRLVAVLVAVAVVGCASSRGQGATERGAREMAVSTSESADSLAASAQRAAAVTIAVGDRIALRVWREPDLSDTLSVDQDGQIILPRLGPYRVSGHSIASLQDSLRARYAAFLRNPAVKVTVFRRVGVQGEVRAPSLYFVDVTMTLREVLAMAGGITEAGHPDKVVVVRGGRQIALGRWQLGGPMSAELRSGDQVVVGRRSWISRNAIAAVSTLGLVVSVLIQVLRKD